MSKWIFSVITDIEEKFPYFAKGVGINHPQEDISRPDGHKEFQWIQSRKGQGELFLHGKRYIVSEGQGMLLFPDEPHSYHALNGEWIDDWIIFHGKGIRDFFENSMNITSSGVYYISSPSKIIAGLENLYGAISCGPSESAACSLFTYNILLDIFTYTSQTTFSSINDKFIKIEPVIDYINKNYNKAITLTDLSSIANMTPQHLCHVFKKLTSKTVFEYINLVKIQKSKQYLCQSRDMLIKEVAYLSGFNDESYFCSMFRRFEKMSPVEFRNMHLGKF